MRRDRKLRSVVFVALGWSWVVLAAVAAQAATVPSDGDAWTENSASLWSRTYGEGALSDDGSTFMVGAKSLKYSVNSGLDGAFQLNLSPAIDVSSLYPSGMLDFWAKIDAPTSGVGGNFGRIELQGPAGSNRAWHTADLGLTDSWQHFSLPFSSGWGGTGDFDPTQMIVLRFSFLGPNRNMSVWVDGLKLAPVPEPASLAAAAAGMALCLAVRRRNK